MNRPRIIGIDPGTTTAWYILDLKGKSVSKGSAKNIGLSKLITEVMAHGTPVIVGTDKKQVPSFVQRFASKFGAQLVSPQQDLQLREKKELVGKTGYKNTHEFDAMASAFLAFETFKPTLSKVDSYVRKHGKDYLSEEIKARLITNDSINIAQAVASLETTKTLPKAKSNIASNEPDTERLLAKVRQLKRSERLLRRQNKRLLEQSKANTAAERKPDNRLIVKDKRIGDLQKFVQRKESEIKELRSQIKQYQSLLSSISQEHVMVKRLPDLSLERFNESNKILRIARKDIVFVESTKNTSTKVVEELSRLGCAIIIKEGPDVPRLVTFRAKDMRLRDATEHFIAVPRYQLKIDGPTFLSKIVKEYRDARQDTLNAHQ